MSGRTWSLILDGERPWTVNGERKMVPRQRAAKVAEWRARTAVIARAESVQRLGAVHVHAWPLVKNRRAMQDVAGCLPAVKAAIDGLVDAGVLEHDGPDVVRALTFTAPVLGAIDGLAITLEEVA